MIIGSEERFGTSNLQLYLEVDAITLALVQFRVYFSIICPLFTFYKSLPPDIGYFEENVYDICFEVILKLVD